jgi:antibiotic biosynthesis monooxygenase (ABM) superfamily enzyme
LPVLRVSLFNFAESWIFALLPPLLADRRRPSPSVVIVIWLFALGLTNAFLAPYMAALALPVESLLTALLVTCPRCTFADKLI